MGFSCIVVEKYVCVGMSLSRFTFMVDFVPVSQDKGAVNNLMADHLRFGMPLSCFMLMVDFVPVGQGKGAVNKIIAYHIRCWHAFVLFCIYG